MPGGGWRAKKPRPHRSGRGGAPRIAGGGRRKWTKTIGPRLLFSGPGFVLVVFFLPPPFGNPRSPFFDPHGKTAAQTFIFKKQGSFPPRGSETVSQPPSSSASSQGRELKIELVKNLSMCLFCTYTRLSLTACEIYVPTYVYYTRQVCSPGLVQVTDLPGRKKNPPTFFVGMASKVVQWNSDTCITLHSPSKLDANISRTLVSYS